MTVPVLYHNATPNVPYNSTVNLNVAGSIINLLDIVLINGINSVNIQSITRVGNLATIVTQAPHTFEQGDTLLFENTGENNFHRKIKFYNFIDSTTFTVLVDDIGATSIGAVGTVKLAPAGGWTKIPVATNVACYRCDNFDDGLPRFIQIEDNSPYGNVNAFRVRIARGWTALDTATKISASRRIEKGATVTRWFIIADETCFYYSSLGISLFIFGGAKTETPLDDNLFMLSTGTEGNTPGSQFGLHGASATVSQTISTANCCVLDSYFNPVVDNFIVSSNFGALEPAATSLTGRQNFMNPYNLLTGELNLVPVGLWEKVADSGQTHYKRGTAKGLFQTIGRVPISFDTTFTKYFQIIRSEQNNQFKDILIFTGINSTTGPTVAFDLNEW
jgi:hypothetical protein